MDLRREDVLEAPYFHVVFTVPAELTPIIYSNQKLLYDALYHAASGALDELCADPKYLGANPPHPCFVPEVPRQVHGGIEEALAGRPPCVWRDIRKIPKPLHIP